MTDMYDHPEYQQFLARIRERPDDDVVRLVFADWLEDWVDANYPHPQSGEAESRAEMIRVQCDTLYNVPCGQVTYPLDGMVGQESLWDMGVECLDYHDGRSERQDGWCPQCKARHRVLQMIEAGDDDTTRHVPHPFLANGWKGFVVKTYDRGFVRAVRGPLASLHGGGCGRCSGSGNGYNVHPPTVRKGQCPECHGTGRPPGVLHRLLAREPIGCDGIEVTDREPYENAAGKFLWLIDTHGLRAELAVIPREVWSNLKGHNEFEYRRIGVKWWDTTDAARLALSRSLYSIHAPQSEVLT